MQLLHDRIEFWPLGLFELDLSFLYGVSKSCRFFVRRKIRRPTENKCNQISDKFKNFLFKIPVDRSRLYVFDNSHSV